MPEATAKNATAPETKAKAPKEAKEKKPSAARSNFAKLYPEDAKVTLMVDSNPKKAGSKSAERFEAYTGAETVADYLLKGGTYQDIAYDVGRGFVKIG